MRFDYFNNPIETHFHEDEWPFAERVAEVDALRREAKQMAGVVHDGWRSPEFRVGG